MDKFEPPLVTVAVLVYKNFQYIKDCVNSILEQNYPRIQLIISDDGSDVFNTVELEKYISNNKGKNIESVFINAMEKNVGTSRNFNYALSLAKGKYVKFIAADDLFFDVDSLSKLVTVAEKESSNVVIARAPNYDMYLERQEWTYPSDEHWQQMKAVSKSPKDFFGIMSQYCLISAPSVLYNRKFLVEMGGADERYRLIEDWPMWMKMLRSGKEFTFLDAPVVIYRSGGVSNGKKNESYAIHQIEYADVIKYECLAYPDAFGTAEQFELAKRSERQHRFNGEHMLSKNQSRWKQIKVALSYRDIYAEKVWSKIKELFWKIQNSKRNLLLAGIILLSICSITDSVTLLSKVFYFETAVLLSNILHNACLGLGWGSLAFSIFLYIGVFPTKFWNTIKYKEPLIK